MIISRTPFRVSLFGGGSDYPQWYRQHGGAVLGFAIDKYCYISVRPLPPFFEHRHRIVYSEVENVTEIDEIRHPAVRAVLQDQKVEIGLEIHHDGDLPARSGLGSSSSFTVGMLNTLYALRGAMIDKQKLAQEAIRIEQRVIGEAVGSQDQVWAAFGGINRIDFPIAGDFQVRPLVMP
jgi:D-glycero-alpha-D-manno-heptose-7-phosphate kinase